MNSDTDDPLGLYLREVASIPELTREEEADLLRQVMSREKQADSAARRLIEANLSLVVSVAEHFRSS